MAASRSGSDRDPRDCGGRAAPSPPTVRRPARRDGARSGSVPCPRTACRPGSRRMPCRRGPAAPAMAATRAPARRPGPRPRPAGGNDPSLPRSTRTISRVVPRARRRVVLAGAARRHLLGTLAEIEQHRPALRGVVDGQGHRLEDENLAPVAVDGQAGRHRNDAGPRVAAHVQADHDAPVVRAEVVPSGRGQAVLLFGAQIGGRQPLPFAIVDAGDAHGLTENAARRSTPRGSFTKCACRLWPRGAKRMPWPSCSTASFSEDTLAEMRSRSSSSVASVRDR